MFSLSRRPYGKMSLLLNMNEAFDENAFENIVLKLIFAKRIFKEIFLREYREFFSL